MVQQELSKRIRKSKTRGRPATPADVAMRLLLLKHLRDWSYQTLVREVRPNLVYRQFTHIGGEAMPDDKTIGRLGRQLGPELIKKLNDRVVKIAQEYELVTGRKMRVDTTVVETNIHYPADSSLLGDGVRVLTRLMLVAPEKGTKMAAPRGARAPLVDGSERARGRGDAVFDAATVLRSCRLLH